MTNIRANGLGVLASFIMGFDQETKGAGDRICAFVAQHNLPVVMVNLLQALPNTALWDRLQEENRLLGTGVSADMVDTNFNFLPARPAAEIMAEYVRAVDYLYEPTNYLARTYQDILAMRPTRPPPPGRIKARTPASQKSRLPSPGPAQRSDGAAPADLAPGYPGRLPVAILAAVSGGLPAQPQPRGRNTWKNAAGEKISFRSGKACWPKRAGPGQTKCRRLKCLTRMALAGAFGRSRPWLSALGSLPPLPWMGPTPCDKIVSIFYIFMTKMC